MQDLWWIGQTFDVAIIGGGINGLAIARDAALRGLRTVLFEQEDIGAGASTKTSKLAHGGVRYLEQGDIPVVLSSLKARRDLLRQAPHLVRPLPFLYPAIKGLTRPLWQIRLGLTLYDWLDWKGNLPAHSYLDPDTLQKLFPDLRVDGLTGCCQYYDAQMDDVRLNVAEMRGAREAGAVIATHTRVTSLVKRGEELVELEFTSSAFALQGTLKASLVINATGAWVSTVMAADKELSPYQLAPSKGVHLIIPQIAAEHALILHAPQDGRVFFLIPWKGMSLLGTTETPFTGDPREAQVEPADREYLLTALRHYFPKWNGPILSEFAGVRPLVSQKGRSLGRISRRHVIERSSSGLISVWGGKYTTFQQVAREVVDQAAILLRRRSLLRACQTEDLPLHGGDCAALLQNSDAVLTPFLKGTQLTLEQARRLIATYGTDWEKILGIVRAKPEEGRPICSLHPHLYAELTYAIFQEQALTPEDWFFRRTSIGYSPCGGRQCYAETAAFFKKKLEVRKETLAR